LAQRGAAGQGAEGVVADRRVFGGGGRARQAFGGVPSAFEGGSVFAAIDGKVLAAATVADPIKETTPAAVKMLHAEGIRVVMLSGDTRQTAEAVGRELGIDELVTEVLPPQNLAKIK